MNPIRNLVNPEKYKQAKKMRKCPTPAENKLWQEIRRENLGVRFGRQRVVRGYIVDFYCPSKKLVIEIDGPIHLKQKEKDSFRDSVIRSLGFEILRFSNEDVFGNFSKVILKIKEGINGNH